MKPANGHGVLYPVTALDARLERKHCPSERPAADTLDHYLKHFRSYRLNPDELTRLYSRVQDRCWRPEERQRAIDVLVQANIGLVVTTVKRLRVPPSKQADAMQEGVIGLMRSLESYDTERGIRFSTYATWWIRHFVLRLFATNGHAIQWSPDVNLAIRWIKAAIQAFVLEHGCEPTDDEFMALARERHQQLERSSNARLLDLRIAGTYRPVRLADDIEYNEHGRELGAVTLQSEAIDMPERIMQQRLRQAIDQALNHLAAAPGKHAARNVALFRTRFNLHNGPNDQRTRTLHEIGLPHDVCRERVRQVVEMVGQQLIFQLVKRQLIAPEHAAQAFHIRWNQL